MRNRDWEGFVTTFCETLQYEFEDAIRTRMKFKGTEKDEYYSGYISAFHHLFTLLKEKSEMTEIPMSEISLDKFKEEDFLI